MKNEDQFRKIDAQIRYYFKEDPKNLSDEEWATRYNEIAWLRKNILEPQEKAGAD